MTFRKQRCNKMISIIKKKKDVLLLMICILLHTIFLYVVCDFRKAIETYGDELAYYSMARSIFYGQGLKVHGVAFQFQNLAYSYYLVPFFYISNSVLRMHAITLANSFLLSLCIVPVWLLCKYIKLNNKYTWMVIILVMFCPDMITAGTMMSESLYWILSLMAIYFCVKSMISNKIIDICISAIVCYLAYFCKEVAVCFPLAYVAVNVLYPIMEGWISKDETKDSYSEKIKRIKGYYKKFFEDKLWIHLFLFMAVYGACYLLFKKILFQGIDSVYDSIVSFSFFTDKYSLFYAFYGLIYYIVATVVAFMVYPILYPMLHYKKLDQNLRKIYLYAMILFIGIIVVIVLTITVKEDLGKVVPRVHLRYIASLNGLFLPVLFRTVSFVQNDNAYMTKRKNAVFFQVLFWVICLFTFKGVLGGCVNENTGLAFSQFLTKYIENIYAGINDAVIFYPAAIVINLIIGILLLIWNRIQYSKNHRKIFPSVLFCTLIFLSIANFNTSVSYLHSLYRVDDHVVTEMSLINNYFKEHGLEKKNMMCISEHPMTKNAKVYDTYFDGVNAFEITYDILMDKIREKEGRDFKISEIDFNESIWGTLYQLDTIDYFILSDYPAGLDSVIGSLERVSEISGDNFTVYKNENPTHIRLFSNTESADRKLFDINFTEEGYNAPLFVKNGISDCEGGYSWTYGDEMLIQALASKSVKSVEINFELDNIYQNQQKVMVYQGEDLIFNEILSGQKEFQFKLIPKNGDCSFRLYFPDAVSPYDLGESVDTRKLALALKEIVIKEIT